MKKFTFLLMAIFVLNLPSHSQSRYVSLDEVRKIADQNASALCAIVSSAEPIAYYAANDELIGYRFNYAIGKPFPNEALLILQSEEASENSDLCQVCERLD
jgi:type IV secretory pathway ATPase VirB11/archaellum biosynthesis ATPase